MFVSNDNLDILGKAWHEQIHTKNAKDPLPGYLTTVLDKIKGFCPEQGVEDGWKSLDKETKGNVALKRG